MMKPWYWTGTVVAVVGALSVATPAGAVPRDELSEDWPMYNHDARGSRHNGGEQTLSRGNVGGLHLAWNFPTPAPVTGTPAVVGNGVYVGDFSASFYRLDAATGAPAWTTRVVAPISASALVTDSRVVFGDLAGFVYGLDRDTGAVRWQIRPNTHPITTVFGSATPIGANIAIGFSSNEEQAPFDPTYPCCNFRGSVALINPLDGALLWHTYLISEAEAAAGANGAAVWSTPTYDEELDLVFVGTGNNYAPPASSRSDSVVALDARTGAIRWSTQLIAGDIWNWTMPIEHNKDADIGDSPQIYRLAGGRKVVGAGSKNGTFFVLDAQTGQLLRSNELQPGGVVGGLFADSAVVEGVVYANGSEWANPFDPTVRPAQGFMTALSGDGANVLWQVSIADRANVSGTAVANGVVFFGAMDPGIGDRQTSACTLYALSSQNGAVLKALALPNACSSGPSISRGRVFMGLGNAFTLGGPPPPGNVVALER